MEEKGQDVVFIPVKISWKDKQHNKVTFYKRKASGFTKEKPFGGNFTKEKVLDLQKKKFLKYKRKQLQRMSARFCGRYKGLIFERSKCLCSMEIVLSPSTQRAGW